MTPPRDSLTALRRVTTRRASLVWGLTLCLVLGLVVGLGNTGAQTPAFALRFSGTLMLASPHSIVPGQRSYACGSGASCRPAPTGTLITAVTGNNIAALLACGYGQVSDAQGHFQLDIPLSAADTCVTNGYPVSSRCTSGTVGFIFMVNEENAGGWCAPQQLGASGTVNLTATDLPPMPPPSTDYITLPVVRMVGQARFRSGAGTSQPTYEQAGSAVAPQGTVLYAYAAENQPGCTNLYTPGCTGETYCGSGQVYDNAGDFAVDAEPWSTGCEGQQSAGLTISLEVSTGEQVGADCIPLSPDNWGKPLPIGVEINDGTGTGMNPTGDEPPPPPWTTQPAVPPMQPLTGGVTVTATPEESGTPLSASVTATSEPTGTPLSVSATATSEPSGTPPLSVSATATAIPSGTPPLTSSATATSAPRPGPSPQPTVQQKPAPSPPSGGTSTPPQPHHALPLGVAFSADPQYGDPAFQEQVLNCIDLFYDTPGLNDLLAILSRDPGGAAKQVELRRVAPGSDIGTDDKTQNSANSDPQATNPPDGRMRDLHNVGYSIYASGDLINGPGAGSYIYITADASPGDVSPTDKRDPKDPHGFCVVLIHELAHAYDNLMGANDPRPLGGGTAYPIAPNGEKLTEEEGRASRWENIYRMSHPPYRLRTSYGGYPLPKQYIPSKGP